MRRSILFTIVIAVFACGTAAAQTVGTIVVAHGGDDGWNRQVIDIAARAKTGGPIEVAFLMGPGASSYRFQDAAQKLVKAGVGQIVVVPLLISSSSGHYDQIRYLAGAAVKLDDVMMHHLHMAGLEPAKVNVPMRVTRAIDDSPAAARVLAERALELTRNTAAHALFIVGHGPNEPEQFAFWMKNLRTLADSVQSFSGFADVRTGVIQDDAPAEVRAEAVKRVRDLIELQHAATKQPVVVVPALISKGSITKEKLPRDLAGLPILFSGEALLPHPLLAKWIEERVADASATALRQDHSSR